MGKVITVPTYEKTKHSLMASYRFILEMFILEMITNVMTNEHKR